MNRIWRRAKTLSWWVVLCASACMQKRCREHIYIWGAPLGAPQKTTKRLYTKGAPLGAPHRKKTTKRLHTKGAPLGAPQKISHKCIKKHVIYWFYIGFIMKVWLATCERGAVHPAHLFIGFYIGFIMKVWLPTCAQQWARCSDPAHPRRTSELV